MINQAVQDSGLHSAKLKLAISPNVGDSRGIVFTHPLHNSRIPKSGLLELVSCTFISRHRSAHIMNNGTCKWILSCSSSLKFSSVLDPTRLFVTYCKCSEDAVFKLGITPHRQHASIHNNKSIAIGSSNVYHSLIPRLSVPLTIVSMAENKTKMLTPHCKNTWVTSTTLVS